MLESAQTEQEQAAAARKRCEEAVEYSTKMASLLEALGGVGLEGLRRNGLDLRITTLDLSAS